MGYVVRRKVDKEVEQRGCYEFRYFFLSVVVGFFVEQLYQVVVVVVGDEQGYFEKDYGYFQSDRQENGQLVFLEFQVVGFIFILVYGGVFREFDDVDYVVVSIGQQLVGFIDQVSLFQFWSGFVLQWVGYIQEAFDVYSCQEERGEIDGGEEEEFGEGVEDERQGLVYVVGCFRYAERQEEQQKQV